MAGCFYSDVTGTGLTVKGVEARCGSCLVRRRRPVLMILKAGRWRSCAVPADYHRYHFPCRRGDRTCGVRALLIRSASVALAARAKILRNKRAWTIIDSPVFGHVAVIEVAPSASPVFTTLIYRLSRRNVAVQRMQKKAISTLAVPPSSWSTPATVTFDTDLREKSAQGIETLVHVGETIDQTRLLLASSNKKYLSNKFSVIIS